MPNLYDADARVFERLLADAKDRRLVPFVGAGLSRCLNDKFPSWADVAQRAAILMGYDPRVLEAIATHYQVGEMLRKEQRLLTGFTAGLRTDLDDPKLATIDDTKPHHWLARLQTQEIYTTNWDHWIEKALNGAGTPFRRIVDPSDLHLKPQPIDLVKFHGDLDAPESLIFAESGYHRRMQFENPLDILLRASCLRSGLLFLGYSLTDMNLRLLWSRIQGSMRDPTAHAYLCIPGDRLVASAVLGLGNVDVIGLDPMNPSNAITSLIHRLVDEQK